MTLERRPGPSKMLDSRIRHVGGSTNGGEVEGGASRWCAKGTRGEPDIYPIVKHLIDVRSDSYPSLLLTADGSISRTG